MDTTIWCSKDGRWVVSLLPQFLLGVHVPATEGQPSFAVHVGPFVIAYWPSGQYPWGD